MRKWTARAARLALATAAITAVGTGIANADDTTGDHSILGGAQLHIPVIAPIGLFGNHVSVLSSVPASSARIAHLRKDIDTDGTASTNVQSEPGSANVQSEPASSNVQMEPASATNICGNAMSAADGISTAACKGQARQGDENAAPTAETGVAPASVEASATKAGTPAVAIGAPESLAAPAEAPASSETPDAAPAAAPAAAQMSTSGQSGVLSGNQAVAPVRVPITICGNAGALGGIATATCEGTASSRKAGAGRMRNAFAGPLG